MPPAYFERNLVRSPIAGLKGTRALVGDPRFVGKSYRLAARSPARGRENRLHTPTRALDGTRRATPPDLGAHN